MTAFVHTFEEWVCDACSRHLHLYVNQSYRIKPKMCPDCGSKHLHSIGMGEYYDKEEMDDILAEAGSK